MQQRENSFFSAFLRALIPGILGLFILSSPLQALAAGGELHIRGPAAETCLVYALEDIPGIGTASYDPQTARRVWEELPSEERPLSGRSTEGEMVYTDLTPGVYLLGQPSDAYPRCQGPILVTLTAGEKVVVEPKPESFEEPPGGPEETFLPEPEDHRFRDETMPTGDRDMRKLTLLCLVCLYSLWLLYTGLSLRKT